MGEPNVNFAQYFIGNSYLKPLAKTDNIFIANVTKPQSLKVGDVVTIPANVKHWHGAKKNKWFSHLAIEVPGENTSNEWCEKVIDEEYDKL